MKKDFENYINDGVIFLLFIIKWFWLLLFSPLILIIYGLGRFKSWIDNKYEK